MSEYKEYTPGAKDIYREFIASCNGNEHLNRWFGGQFAGENGIYIAFNHDGFQFRFYNPTDSSQLHQLDFYCEQTNKAAQTLLESCGHLPLVINPIAALFQNDKFNRPVTVSKKLDGPSLEDKYALSKFSDNCRFSSEEIWRCLKGKAEQLSKQLHLTGIEFAARHVIVVDSTLLVVTDISPYPQILKPATD